jgi:hypothetical protein
MFGPGIHIRAGGKQGLCGIFESRKGSMMKGSPSIIIEVIDVCAVSKELVRPDCLAFRSRMKECLVSSLLAQLIV